MHHFDPPPPPPKRHGAIGVWLACTALLLAPSLLVWIVRGVAMAAQCVPGPDLCRGMTLGGGLRDTLDLSWILGSDMLLLVLISLVAAVAALCARRPLLAGLSLLLLPIAAVLLPIFAVSFSRFDGCQVNESGVGDCVLWGAHMGMSMHQAAIANGALLDMAPYSIALALMVGAIGFLFFREVR
jgi:hypothetical protein